MNPLWIVSLFWISTVVCVVIALAFVLPALLRPRSGGGRAERRDVNIAVYRDQMREMELDRVNGLLSDAQYQSAKRELEVRLADDALTLEGRPEPGRASSRKLGYAWAIFLPVLAFWLYFTMGNPALLRALAEGRAGSGHSAMAGVSSEHDFTKMIQRVEEKTRNNPDDGEAWSMLAKTYAAVGQWPGALQAFEKAMKLLPGDASVLSGYAEALAIANNRVLAGKPVELVQKALEIDPEDIKGLELAGIHAFQTQRFEQASVYLKRLYNLLPPNDPYAQDILATQKEAERLAFPGLAGMGSPDISPAVTESRSSPVQGGRVAGRVDIAPALKSRLDGSATVFLFARPGAGGAPVAAVRSTVDSLPLEFSLDDSMAMNPVNVLSQHMEVALVARVSMSGNPMSQPGDFEGSVSGVKVGTTGVKLLIDRVLP